MKAGPSARDGDGLPDAPQGAPGGRFPERNGKRLCWRKAVCPPPSARPAKADQTLGAHPGPEEVSASSVARGRPTFRGGFGLSVGRGSPSGRTAKAFPHGRDGSTRGPAQAGVRVGKVPCRGGVRAPPRDGAKAEHRMASAIRYRLADGHRDLVSSGFPPPDPATARKRFAKTPVAPAPIRLRAGGGRTSR